MSLKSFIVKGRTSAFGVAATLMLSAAGCSNGMNPMGMIGGSMFGGSAAAPAGGVGVAQQAGFAGGMMGGGGKNAAGNIAGQVGGQMLVNQLQNNAQNQAAQNAASVDVK